MFSAVRHTDAVERFAGPLVGMKSCTVGLELLVNVEFAGHENVLKLGHASSSEV